MPKKPFSLKREIRVVITRGKQIEQGGNRVLLAGSSDSRKLRSVERRSCIFGFKEKSDSRARRSIGGTNFRRIGKINQANLARAVYQDVARMNVAVNEP
ncbi:MAG: hypothetical protein WAK16_12905 [Candidatus Cybelea sp.]